MIKLESPQWVESRRSANVRNGWEEDVTFPSWRHTKPKTQADKFKEAARELECDDDPERFREKLGKLVKHKPVKKPE